MKSTTLQTPPPFGIHYKIFQKVKASPIVLLPSNGSCTANGLPNITFPSTLDCSPPPFNTDTAPKANKKIHR